MITEKRQNLGTILPILVLLLFTAAIAAHYALEPWGFYRKVSEALAQNYTVQYTDSWCATFVSAVSIRCGLTDILPTECSCERLIGLFGELDCWQEDDNYTPLPGDIIFYDWDEKRPGDCTGWADHVGIVVGTKWPFVKVIEGNRDDAVAYCVIPLGEIHIRGYGLPDYAAVAENTL